MEAHEYVQLDLNTKVEDFRSGDTVKVSLKVIEGDRERIQVFEGLVIRKKGTGSGSTFTVRRISHSIGVEKTFLLYSPIIESVSVIKRGDVRRARLYYIRKLSGRAARIKELRNFKSAEESKEAVAEEPKAEAEESKEAVAEEPKAEVEESKEAVAEEPKAEAEESTEDSKSSTSS